MIRHNFILLLPLGSLALAACNAPAMDVPSLQARPVEKLIIGEQPGKQQPAQVSMEIADRIVHWRHEFDQASNAFQATLTQAQTLVGKAKNSAKDSEAWVSAQIELSSLITSRRQAAFILSEIDEAYLDAEVAQAAGSAPGNAAALAGLQSEIARSVSEQNRIIDTLRSTLQR